jgi:hypothetical protein
LENAKSNETPRAEGCDNILILLNSGCVEAEVTGSSKLRFYRSFLALVKAQLKPEM